MVCFVKVVGTAPSVVEVVLTSRTVGGFLAVDEELFVALAPPIHIYDVIYVEIEAEEAACTLGFKNGEVVGTLFVNESVLAPLCMESAVVRNVAVYGFGDCLNGYIVVVFGEIIDDDLAPFA